MSAQVGEPGRDALVALMAGANDAPYPLGPVAREKCFGEGLGGSPQLVLSEEDDELTGAAVLCGPFLRLLGVDRRRRRRGVGADLLRRAEEAARLGGERTLTVGAEPGNYFVPGLLEDDEPIRRLLERRGYVVTGAALNLTADLRERHWEGRPAPAGVVIDRATTAARAEVEAFVAATFSHAWRFEVSHAFADPSPPLFVARRGGVVVGFSAHEVNNRGLGCYGPAGVHPDERGAGLGAALLRASLTDLADRGHAQAIIPWVSSVDFYRKVARARPAHRFVTYRKDL